MIASADDSTARERARQMLDLSIGFDGRQYVFGGYHYDHLEDAANYAWLIRKRQCGGTEPPMPAATADDRPALVPSTAERTLMVELGIRLANGRYELRGYRYDHLADAVGYARHLGEVAANGEKRASCMESP